MSAPFLYRGAFEFAKPIRLRAGPKMTSKRTGSEVTFEGELPRTQMIASLSLSPSHRIFPFPLSPLPPPARSLSSEMVIVEERIRKTVKGSVTTFLKIDTSAMSGDRSGWAFDKTPDGTELLMEVEVGHWEYRSAFPWKKPLLARNGPSMQKATKIPGAKVAYVAPYTSVDICERTLPQTIKGTKFRFLRLSASSKNPSEGVGGWLIDTNLSNGMQLLILRDTIERPDVAAQSLVEMADEEAAERKAARHRRRVNDAIARGAVGMKRLRVKAKRKHAASPSGKIEAAVKSEAGDEKSDDSDDMTVAVIVKGRGACEGMEHTVYIDFDITAEELVERHLLEVFERPNFSVDRVTIRCGGDEIEPDEPMEEYVLFGTPVIDAVFEEDTSKLGILEDRYIRAPRRKGEFVDALDSATATVESAVESLAPLLATAEGAVVYEGLGAVMSEFMALGGVVAVAPIAAAPPTAAAAAAADATDAATDAAEQPRFTVGVELSDIVVAVCAAGTRRAQTARLVLAGVKRKLGSVKIEALASAWGDVSPSRTVAPPHGATEGFDPFEGE